MSAVLEVERLSMRFDSIMAADEVNVTVGTGEFVGIIGPNGAGKTTFLNLVTGYVRPQDGRIRFNGADIVGSRPHRVAAMGVGRSFQVPQLFTTLTVLDNMLVALATSQGRSQDFWGRLKQDERIERARTILGEFGLEERVERPASDLPEGGRKLLDVALAFALGPRLLLMDEPTSGVSVDDKFEVMDTLAKVLKESGVTTMFVEHDMDVVRRYAERVLVFSEGRIIADGGPAEVLGDEEIQRAVAGWG